LRSLSDKIGFKEGQQRYEEHKFELLSMTDLQMVAIGCAIERAMFLIDEKNYRCAFETLCTTRHCFMARAHHAAAHSNGADISNCVVFEIPPVPQCGYKFECPLDVRRIPPTPKLPTQNSFIHFHDAGSPVPTPIDLKRSSTEPVEASRSWEDNSSDISTCDGYPTSDVDAINGDPFDVDASDPASDVDASDHASKYADFIAQRWHGQQWGASVWPSQCAVEANLAMASWAQQFCLPGFSVQMIGIVPWETDGHGLVAGNPQPFSAGFDSVELPPSAMAQQPRPPGGEGNYSCFVFDHMASSLRSFDTTIVKKCYLEVGNFTVTVAPKRATLKKGGSSFRASKGQCTAQVKCNSEINGEIDLALGLGNAPALVTVRHNFSKQPVCSIPGVLDLKNALDENASLFRLTFEFTVV